MIKRKIIGISITILIFILYTWIVSKTIYLMRNSEIMDTETGYGIMFTILIIIGYPLMFLFSWLIHEKIGGE